MFDVALRRGAVMQARPFASGGFVAGKPGIFCNIGPSYEIHSRGLQYLGRNTAPVTESARGAGASRAKVQDVVAHQARG